MNGQACGPKGDQSKRGFALIIIISLLDDYRGYFRSPGIGGIPFDDYTFMSLSRRGVLFLAGMDLHYVLILIPSADVFFFFLFFLVLILEPLTSLITHYITSYTPYY